MFLNEKILLNGDECCVLTHASCRTRQRKVTRRQSVSNRGGGCKSCISRLLLKLTTAVHTKKEDCNTSVQVRQWFCVYCKLIMGTVAAALPVSQNSVQHSSFYKLLTASTESTDKSSSKSKHYWLIFIIQWHRQTKIWQEKKGAAGVNGRS